MSLAQIKAEIQRLSPEERAEVEKLLRILRVTSAPGYHERIAQANAEMDAGIRFSREDLQAVLAQDRAAGS